MSKKYYDLEEAAALLGMPKEELNRLREQGQIRGFADRGTWKFRDEDVDKLRRTRQIDSDPDVPLMIDESSGEIDTAGSVLADDDALAEQPTIVSKRDPLKSSDSDVRLAVDSDSDVKLISDAADSDSDVKLIGEQDSASDVKLVGAAGGKGGEDLDSTQPLMAQTGGGDSDSDVRLVDSDSEVRLSANSLDEDVSILAGEDSQIALDFSPDDSEGASVLSEESGLALGDSSMLLAGESGISLEGPSDSGSALSIDDEGITIAPLDPDSDVSLDLKTDSDITLDTGSDSGISLEDVNDSGISLDDSIEVGAGTVAMMDIADEDDVAETQFEIPVGSSDDSAFELSSEDATGVLNLDDSGEATLDDAIFELDEEESGDMFADAEDELEVADEILGEDDELDELDVFDADDDVFGESGPQFAAPVAAGGGPFVEPNWGVGTLIGLGVSSVCMLMLGIIMFDLVKTMWQSGDPSTVGGALLSAFRGLYGGS